MKRFSFIVDEKVKVWNRDYVNVEAETLEEAIQKCVSGDCRHMILRSCIILQRG